MPENPADDVRPLDPRSLRGLAHPLRMRLLSALREYGPATASGLADRLGESSGATSYHLRQLAAHGFVEDDPGRGTARERWWKAAHRGTRFDSVEEFLHHPDPAVRGAMNTFMYERAAVNAEQVSTWLGTMREWPEAWQKTWDLSDFALRLSPEVAGELIERVHELIESYRDAGPAGREPSTSPEPGTDADASTGTDGSTAAATDTDTAMVRFQFQAFPRRAD
ncbi:MULTISPECIES: winged helix-turn-helix domain-containing protein [unclassified Streptomyces]|uniref:winged helix-turn-helix domain-containing protein n=1 Tax=unclassified Streptomyces TaxID=2593676 RepID=UPI002E2B750D|nr:winged helix-turn-helix domain-containing protein [Streptomyces sp. NBC_00223]